VTAVATGSANITATSEGKSGSATLTVTAAPPPPPPSGEPIFQPGSDQQLYTEDFESFNSLTALQTFDFTRNCYLYNNPSLQQFPSPSPAHTGTKAFRINYPVSTSYNDQDTVLECTSVPSPSGSTQFAVVEFWLRTKPGYPWRRAQATDQQGAGEKTFIWNQGSSSVPRFVISPGDALGLGQGQWGGAYESALPPSNIAIVLIVDGAGVVTGNSGSYWYFQNINGALRDPLGYLNDGNYHLWKMKLTPGTFQNGTGGNGSIEMWVDGVKVMEFLGNDPKRPEYNQVLVPTVRSIVQSLDIGGPFNGGPSPAQGAQWKDYDDIRIWARP
jgi:hypothetical protein